MKRIYPSSLKSLLLFYETAFLILVVSTGVMGGLWAYYGLQSSRELMRLNTLMLEAQQIRGDLYTQIKQVSRARLTEDHSGLAQYQQYLALIERHFLKLDEAVTDAREQLALDYMKQTYTAVRKDMDKISADPYLVSQAPRMKLLDPLYEEWMLAEFESALLILQRVLERRQQELNTTLQRWTSLAPWALSLTIALALLLLLLSRRSLQRGFILPMRKLIHGTALYSQGDLNHRIEPEGVAEAVRMAQSFNHMAEELSIKRKALVASERQAALGSLVPVVAHNIRNPLASIRATAQVLDADEDAQELQQARNAIIETVDRLERWVSALLSYLHPQRPCLTECRIGEVIDGALQPLESKILEKRLTLSKAGWTHPEYSALVDIDLMEQAIYGLLNNAVDASPPHAMLTISVTRESGSLNVCIDDQGAGMPFDPEPGGLAPGPSTKRFGTGLGIPFAFKACEAHRGSLSFVRLPQGGTRAVIKLPLKSP